MPWWLNRPCWRGAWGWPVAAKLTTRRTLQNRPIAPSPHRPIAPSPHRPIAPSPHRLDRLTGRDPGGHCRFQPPVRGSPLPTVPESPHPTRLYSTQIPVTATQLVSDFVQGMFAAIFEASRVLAPEALRFLLVACGAPLTSLDRRGWMPLATTLGREILSLRPGWPYRCDASTWRWPGCLAVWGGEERLAGAVVAG